MLLKNKQFFLDIKNNGIINELRLLGDPYKMNWVISEDYLNDVQYVSKDKLFGQFNIKIENKNYSSYKIDPLICIKENACILTYSFANFDVLISYDLNDDDLLYLGIKIINKASIPLKIQEFIFWSSFSDVMFRDKHVARNIFQSAAVFPSISTDFTKVAIMRRSSNAPSLGLYEISGETLSIGSYCEFENNFFEAVSPSLDGVLFHSLILSGGEEILADDWMYPAKQLNMASKQVLEWSYVIAPIIDQKDFYLKGQQFGHQIYTYEPLVKVGEPFNFSYEGNEKIDRVIAFSNRSNSVTLAKNTDSIQSFYTTFTESGEHKLEIYLSNGKRDQVIINVVSNLTSLIDDRVHYLCENSYRETDSGPVFLPISNQGESLGKLSLIVKKNLLGSIDRRQIQKVEKSLNEYVLKKWFYEGDFLNPRKLYGQFYRVMDFEYLGHLLYLLSLVPKEYLSYQLPEVYLQWAAQVVEMRINPELHEGFREKEESEMLGVFFLYIDDLLAKLKEKKLGSYHKLSLLWENNIFKILEEKKSYGAAMTEHFYDNAGFGPAAASLANAHYHEECLIYGDLLLANIGFSNDFRMQNPDRWWESLAYMIHSLWGGISAAAALDVFHEVKDPLYLEASYRAFVGVLYCYDSDATATTRLNKGEAASTFACANPHFNCLDLAHQRFGQEVFAKDGGIFSGIFDENQQQTSDWDMGEELVAYLDRFGQDAYGYFDQNNQLRLINCHLEQYDGQSYIKSDAPFPRTIYMLKEKTLFSYPDNVQLEKVLK